MEFASTVRLAIDSGWGQCFKVLNSLGCNIPKQPDDDASSRDASDSDIEKHLVGNSELGSLHSQTKETSKWKYKDKKKAINKRKESIKQRLYTHWHSNKAAQKSWNQQMGLHVDENYKSRSTYRANISELHNPLRALTKEKALQLTIYDPLPLKAFVALVLKAALESQTRTNRTRHLAPAPPGLVPDFLFMIHQ